jgi:hypothetical protein
VAEPVGDTDLTKGWDAVFAVRYSVLNRAIGNAYTTRPDALPTKFSGATKGRLGSSKVEGTWDPWQVTTGGSGIYLQMNCPIASGSYNDGAFDLASCTVVIRVQLEFFDHKAGDDASLQKALKLKLDKSDASSPPVVLVTILDKAGNPLEAGDIGALGAPLNAWFTDNLVAFDHVFCVVDMADAESASAALDWLKPAYTAYAAAEPAATKGLTHEQIMDQSVFAVLHTIEGREPAGLAAEIDLNAIPMGKGAAFNLSRPCFIRHFIEPALPFLFQIDTSRCTDKESVRKLLAEFGRNFELTNDDKMISNKRNLKLPPMKLPEDAGNKIVQPDIKAGDFSIEVDGQLVRVTFNDMHYEYSHGIDVYLTYKSELQLSLKDKRLNLEETRRSIKGQVTKSTDVQIFQIAGGILLAVALVPLGGAAGKALGGLVSRAASAAAAEVTEETTQILVQAVEVTTEDIATLTTQEIEAAEQEVAQEVAAESASIFSRAARMARAAKGYFMTNPAKIAGGMVGGGVAATVDSIPDIMIAVATNDLKNIPDLTKFSQEVLFNVAWTDVKGFEPETAELHDAIQIAGTVHMSSAAEMP